MTYGNITCNIMGSFKKLLKKQRGYHFVLVTKEQTNTLLKKPTANHKNTHSFSWLWIRILTHHLLITPTQMFTISSRLMGEAIASHMLKASVLIRSSKLSSNPEMGYHLGCIQYLLFLRPVFQTKQSLIINKFYKSGILFWCND